MERKIHSVKKLQNSNHFKLKQGESVPQILRPYFVESLHVMLEWLGISVILMKY